MMTPMYRSIIFALSLSAVFFLSNSSANAQEQVFIFGDQYLCPGQCGAWFIEFPTSDDYLYEWQFVGANGFFFEITTEGYEPVTTCDLFEPGSYSIEVTVFSPDGVIIAQGGYEFFVDFEGDLFGEVYGTHTTECEQDTFAFTFPGGLNDCYEVCVGTVSTISLDEILLSGGISDSLIISQGQWSVSNGTIQPNGSTGGDANFNIPEVFASSGQEVCLPITVNNFDNIAGGQFSINYNAAILTNVAATSVTNEIPGFSIESISFPTPGSVTVSWSSVGTATTLPDGSELFELCFFVSGTTSSAVLFSSAPTPAEIIDGNGNVVPFDGSSGAVIIGTAPPEVITILWDEEGPGFASFNFWTVTPNGCEVFSSIDFCFDVVPPPPADFTTQPPAGPSGILEICEGQTVFFTAESTEADAYLWDFGDGGGSSLQNPQYTFASAGTFEVELITSAGCNCADTSQLTVVVEGNDAPFVDCVATICEGTSVTYTANTGCSNYVWEISGNGTVLDGGGTSDDFITIQWGGGPIGEITLDTDGCPDLSDCTEAAYLQIPIISNTTVIDGPQQVCRGDQSVYSVPPFEGTEFTWSVTSFGTIIDGQGTPTVTIEWFDGFIPPGAQQVSVDYNNCYLECGGSASLEVFVRPEFYLTGEIELCADGSAEYSVINTQTNTGFPANFEVQAADGTVVWTSPGAGSNFTIDWTFGAGTYTVLATPQDPSGYCVAAAELPVNILPAPPAVTAIIGQSDICAGIAYAYSIDDPVDGERYRWTINNAGTVTEREGTTIAVTWQAGGPYALSVVRLTPPLFCSSSETSLAITPVSSFAISGDDQVCLDQIAAYTSDQTGDVFYDWSISPGSAGTITGSPADANIEVLWHSAGPATVLLDICGQQETFTVNVNAPPQPTVNAPAALCPGSTAMVSTAVAYSTYSWQDEEGNELSTDPTPDLGGGYYRVEVTDAFGCLGRETFQIYEYPESQISISTPDFTIFCNVAPFSRLYAVNTEDGYNYQWFQDGTPLAGETSSTYTAMALGNYWVDIIDENGCSFSSNTITLENNCGSGQGTGGGPNCNNPDHSFTSMDNGACDDRSYTAIADGNIPGSVFWIFDDPDSGANNTATGENVSHLFSKPGFYRIFMFANYDNMGTPVTCVTMIPDTVLAVAEFDYDGVCPGAPVQFYDLTTYLDLANIVSWDWDFGDPASGGDNTSTDKDPIHTFSADGDYTVTLTVTMSSGCTTTRSQTVSIFPYPFTNFAEPDVSCAMTSLEFIADVEATVSDVVWDFGEPASGDANSSILFNSFHSYGAPGSYNVSLEATSIYGCVNTFDRTIDIEPNNLSGEIDPAGLSTLCEGDDLLLTAPASTAVSWLWSTMEDTQSISVNEAGTYSVLLTDAEGCTYTPAPAVVDIIPAPQSPIRAVEYNDFNQPISYTYDTLYVCFGEDVFLETITNTGYTYQWSSGDTDEDTEFTEDRGNLLAPGEHLITLDVTDTSTGCSAVESFLVVVRPTPDIPVLDAGGGALCSGTSHTISITNTASDLVYFWSNGDTGTSVTTDEAGEYFVTAVNIFGCRSESEVTEVLEGPQVSLVPNGCFTRCAPDTLCLPTIPDVVSYQWYQDGMAIPSPEGTIPNLVIMESGSYTLEMEDVDGCVQTSSPLNIDILPGFGTIFGNVFFDLDDDETISAGDGPAEDIPVEIVGDLGLTDVAITDENGIYGFVNIPEDDYTLSIDSLDVPAGWTPQISSIDTTFVGCDQEITIDWLLIRACDFDTNFVANVCQGEDFMFQGVAYPVGSDNVVQSNGATGCDTTFMFTVAALPTTTETLAVSVCTGETYNYQGTEYPAGTDETIVLMNAAGCDSVIQLQVLASPAIDFDFAVAESCLDFASGTLAVTVNDGVGPFVYAIDDGSFQTNADFQGLEVGPYSLTVEDANGCQETEDFTVQALPSLVVNLQDQILPCSSPEIQLVPEIISGDDGFLQFLWSDGVATLERPVSAPGTLELEVSNGCELVSVPVTIEPEISAQSDLIYVPNAFSPNNDGVNDDFRLFPSDNALVEELDFQVFDRWGSMLFDAQSWDDAWTGVNKGQRASSGTYIWRLEAKINLCGQLLDVVEHGEIILVR
ncbi:MAG: PKD domain-containing protein [Bacteroidota bacterium]